MTDHDEAKRQAQAQWNATPCGQVDGDATTLAYFLRVETERYRQQAWAHAYFGWHRFEGRHVLEIGTGHGTDLAQFAKAGAICHGVDVTANHLALTAQNFALRGFPLDLHEADAAALPFDDATFDCVYSFGVLHHIPDVERVLSEIRRVLKPGGQIMMAVYNKWSLAHLEMLVFNGLLKGWLFTKGYDGVLASMEMGADGVRVKPYVRLYSQAEVRRMLVSAGFTVDDVSVHQLDSHRFDAIVRPMAPFFERWFGWYVAAIARV